MKMCYKERRFKDTSIAIIDEANEILEDLSAQGFTLTVRQLYYRLVTRNTIANNEKSYQNLISVINDARLAGLIDWQHLEDRTRHLRELEHFIDGRDALRRLASWYHIDMWERQYNRPEVWIEKDALVGVIADVCQENDVPYFSCRGFASASELWRAGRRMAHWIEQDQRPLILYFGDHDPSGIDMSRDVQARLELFIESPAFDFKRVALTMTQIKRLGAPPQPAKMTDARAKRYVAQYGNQSWELDALDPRDFRQLIQDELDHIRDQDQWDRDEAAKLDVKERLVNYAKRFKENGS